MVFLEDVTYVFELTRCLVRLVGRGQKDDNTIFVKAVARTWVFSSIRRECLGCLRHDVVSSEREKFLKVQ